MKGLGVLVSKGEIEDAKELFRPRRIWGMEERGCGDRYSCHWDPQIQPKLTETHAVGSQQEGHGVLFRHPIPDFNTTSNSYFNLIVFLFSIVLFSLLQSRYVLSQYLYLGLGSVCK